MAMLYTNSSELIQKYPSLTTGLVLAKRIINGPSSPEVEQLLRPLEAELPLRFDPATLSSHPHIASWRQAYSAFGVKPSKYNSAPELLVRRVLKDGGLPRINKLVDLCNYLSLKYILPAAAYDLAAIKGDITVGLAKGTERFLPLYGTEIEPPEPGEVVYQDEEKCLSRRWNWRQCEQARIRPETENVVITVEGLEKISPLEVERATAELAQLVPQLCGGTATQFILNRTQPWAELEAGKTLPASSPDRIETGR